MLIKLLPLAPHPSVLFNITFEDYPDGLSLPQAWTTHLSNILHDELTIPKYQHALDKASFLPCVLEEVVFDIAALSITCKFVDGSSDSWNFDLEGPEKNVSEKCLKTLESVVDDVYLSTLEYEKEKEKERQRDREREKEREREREKERLRQLQHSSSSPKNTKHKKKRSLLMTIVSGLSSLNSMINLSLPSPTIPSPMVPLSSSTLPTYEPSTSSLVAAPSPLSKQSLPSGQCLCPRFLRRRARSSLVDAFRLVVLPGLVRRVPQGGYYVWILHSHLKHIRQLRDATLARERERDRGREGDRILVLDPLPPYRSSVSNCSSTSSSSGSCIIFGRRNPQLKSHDDGVFSATTASEPPASDDEEEESDPQRSRLGIPGSDTDTETEEGSSIHTPGSSQYTLPLSTPAPLPSRPSSTNLVGLAQSASINYSSTQGLQSHQVYPPASDPTELRIRNLTHLILLHNSHAARNAHDDATRVSALEVRGRRRAWLNKSLCPDGLRSTSMPSNRIHITRKYNLEMGAGFAGLGFAIPLSRSSLGKSVVNADDLEDDPVQVQFRTRHQNPLTSDADDRGEDGGRYAGFDERNGFEPRRYKVPVPSRLLPVNEVEEEDGQFSVGAPHVTRQNSHSESVDDDPTFQLASLNLNQYDDLKELQMDLDIVTGVGFDMDFSSDEEEDGKRVLEGETRVASDKPKQKVFHARSVRLVTAQDTRRKQSQMQTTNLVQRHDSEHAPQPVSHIPPHVSPSLSSLTIIAPLSPSPHVCEASRHQPSQSLSSSSITIANNVAFKEFSGSYDDFKPLASQVDLENGLYHNQTSPGDFVMEDNCHGMIISGMDEIKPKEGEGEEFTLAMDLPSKSLSSKFGSMRFTTIGRTRNFRGRARGAMRMKVDNPSTQDLEARRI